MYLHTGLEEIKVGNRESLLNALKDLSSFDCDFNGESGDEFLWVGAEGYDSNMDYLIDKVRNIEDDEECINTFFNTWLSADCYYAKWDVSVITDTKKRAKVVSFPAVSEY